MEEDYQLLTMEQWNAWWKKDHERSQGKGAGDDSHHQEHEPDHDEHPFSQPSPMLQKYIMSLIPDENRRRIFVPLCGKSPDMKWLVDAGYEVVGLECSEHAILELYGENSIEFEVASIPEYPEFRVFKAKDANLSVIQGDYFKVTPEIAGGLFHGVWDTASLNTIDLSQRKPYVQVMRSLMAKRAKYMLSAMYFGELRTWKNNPFDITDNDMTELFANDFTWTKLDEDNSEFGLERIFLLSFK